MPRLYEDSLDISNLGHCVSGIGGGQRTANYVGNMVVGNMVKFGSQNKIGEPELTGKVGTECYYFPPLKRMTLPASLTLPCTTNTVI